MSATIVFLLIAVHLGYALLWLTLGVHDWVLVTLMEGVKFSSLALLAASAALGPGPPIRRLPMVALLAVAWFCAAGFGDRLAGGQVNYNHMISDATMAIVAFPLAAMAVAMLSCRNRMRIVRLPLRPQEDPDANRFSLSQLWFGVTAAAIGCGALCSALTPYPWQVTAGTDDFAWTEWLANHVAEDGVWQLTAFCAILAALPWALLPLGRVQSFGTWLVILAGGMLLAASLCLMAQFWTHLSVWPANPSTLRIHYVGGVMTYLGVSLGVASSAIYLRAVGWRMVFGQTWGIESPDGGDARRRARQGVGIASLAATLLIMAGFAASSVHHWCTAYDQERRQKAEWQEKFDQQRRFNTSVPPRVSSGPN